MKYQVKSFDVVKTSTIVGAMYFGLSLVIFIPVGLIMAIVPAQKAVSPFGSLFLIFVPFLYGFMGFLFTALMCLFYNFCAKHMDGIAFELEKAKGKK